MLNTNLCLTHLIHKNWSKGIIDAISLLKKEEVSHEHYAKFLSMSIKERMSIFNPVTHIALCYLHGHAITGKDYVEARDTCRGNNVG